MNRKIDKRFTWLIILALVGLVVSSCTGSPVVDPTLPFPTETPLPSATPEPAEEPALPTATPYPSGDTWDLSEEKPLEDWQVEVVLADLEQFWDVWQNFEGALDCDKLDTIIYSASAEIIVQSCMDEYKSGQYILGPQFEWLSVVETTTWPKYKGTDSAWPGGLALKLDTEGDWETLRINPEDGDIFETLYGKRTIYYAFLVFEEEAWRIYSLDQVVEGIDF